MRMVVTAGPTHEPLDPVRFLSNRSSGKMGFAIAGAAAEAGWEVVLISGPVALATPPRIHRVDVTTAIEMLGAVRRELAQADALVMAAAVADWRPAEVSGQKMKKRSMDGVLKLIRNPDILKELTADKGSRIHVGFAAESTDLLVEAERKMKEKSLDMIVANDILASDAGFGVDTNRVTFLFPDSGPEALPLLSKRQVADRIVEWITCRFRSSQSIG